MHNKTIWTVLVVVLAIVLCGLFAPVTTTAPYAYDEADYMFSGAQGFWANYVDRGALTMFDFIGKGLELVEDPSLRGEMSQFIRNSGDLSFYRHYHGPMYAYWVWFWSTVGVREEATFRGVGLILHALGGFAIFWLFLRCFPELPAAAAFVAAAAYLMNRTTLLTSITITQHLIFQCLSYLSLFAVAMYLRTQSLRWWYATAALLAVSLATVEISAVLIASALLSVLLWHWKDGMKFWAGLLSKGIACFLLTMVAVWPAGVLKLNVLKGFSYLAYMALNRKSFTAGGPGELWVFRLKTYPLEFVLPLAALAAALVLFPKLRHRREATPFLVYGCTFFMVTLVVTLDYTYYHGSMMAATAILTGVVFGELWQRAGTGASSVLLAVILLTLGQLDRGFYEETKAERSAPTLRAQLLGYLEKGPAGKFPAAKFYVPFALVPPLHYYRPDIGAVAYNADWSVRELADMVATDGAGLVCSESVCAQVEALGGMSATQRILLGTTKESPEPVYVTPPRVTGKRLLE